MAKIRKSFCWSIQPSDYRTPLIVTDIMIFSPITGMWNNIQRILVDTGYDGDLLLDFSIYQQLGFSLIELPESFSSVAETIDGTKINLHGTGTSIRWGEKEFEIKVESLPKNTENLLGRGLFLRYSNLYDSDKKVFCLN